MVILLTLSMIPTRSTLTSTNSQKCCPPYHFPRRPFISAISLHDGVWAQTPLCLWLRQKRNSTNGTTTPARERSISISVSYPRTKLDINTWKQKTEVIWPNSETTASWASCSYSQYFKRFGWPCQSLWSW